MQRASDGLHSENYDSITNHTGFNSGLCDGHLPERVILERMVSHACSGGGSGVE